jgi:hypothetical protein
VTQRGFAIVKGDRVPSKHCELKCRRCLAKWRAKAGYTSELPDYTERHWQPFSYEGILELVKEDRLLADYQRGLVFKELKHGKRWTGKFKQLTIRRQRSSGSSGAVEPQHCYVVLVHNKQRREISLARLIWMIYHRVAIPPAYDVDHADDDPTNNAITNLVAVELETNRGQSEHEGSWDQVPF